MDKKLLWFGLPALLIVIVVATVLLLSRSPPPPVADEIGATPAGMQAVVAANNRFAFDLYGELAAKPGNLFYSPYSVSAALAMVYEGADGKTAEEMASVLHVPEAAVLRPNFAALYNDLNAGAKGYELSTGNALWAQENYPFSTDYLTRVGQYYGGVARNLDFAGDPEGSKEVINAYIEDQTQDRIKDIISAIDPSTRLIVTNAIYFKGSWEWEFKKSDTRDQDFTIAPDRVIKVPMMSMVPKEARFKYAKTDGVQLLELPYKGEKLSMLILLPEGDLAALESSLTAERLDGYKAMMRETKLDSIYLPRFEFDTKYSLNDALISLGMPTAFSDRADFSGMTAAEQLYIGQVIHQAFVKVDEQGTEAAAATVVMMVGSSMAEPTVFRADHPFLFIIQETASGNILFMGRVTDPTA